MTRQNASASGKYRPRADRESGSSESANGLSTEQALWMIHLITNLG